MVINRTFLEVASMVVNLVDSGVFILQCLNFESQSC